MLKIKGLLTGIKGNEEASIMILPFNKRIEEYLKIMKRINQVYDKIFIDPFTSFVIQLSNLNKSMMDEFKSYKNRPESYSLVFEIFTDIQKIIKGTNHEIKSYSDEGFKAIIGQCLQIKKICDALSQKLNLHEGKETDLNQSIKKYSKSHKNFLQAMESYKMAFQDVKLIYNIEEKTKRYKLCSSFFTASVSDLQEIDQTIKLLTDQRSELKGLLEKFRTKSLQFIRIVAQEVIKIPQNIVKCFMKSNKELFKLISEKSKIFKEKQTKSFFEKFRLPFPNPEFFFCDLKQTENELYPSFLLNLKSMKAEHFGKCKKYLVEYHISTREDIKERSQMNEKLKNYLIILNGIFEKIFINEQKEIKELMNDKYMKLVETHFTENQQETAGTLSLKIPQTILKMAEFLDENRELVKNMNKMYSQHVKQIISEIDEENKNMLVFKDEFKNKFYNLFSGKKEFKKDMQILKSGQIENFALSQDQAKEMRSQILKKSEFIILLINGFSQKFKNSSGKIKNLLEAFIDDLAKHQNYEKVLYEKYKQKLDDLTTILIQKRLHQPDKEKTEGFWVDKNSLYQAIVIEKMKIKFDSQIEKVNEFKKVKKPTQNFDENNLSSSGQRQKQASPIKKEATESSSKPFSKNYEQFIRENTKFQEGQKYVSNYTCGLCDNIIISGRLYITTHRLFFHSRFNSSNIFFGETKLQIPRSDIKKIEKKYNAIIFDNSISITTINGEIFFTSFVSRNVAYDLICKTFDINLDEEVFITEEVNAEVQGQDEAENFNLNIEQEDDMPEGDLEERARKIDEMIQKDESSDQKAQQISYQNVSSEDFTFVGLNAVKMFKIFQSGQQMPYKNKTYESFWHYFKGYIHKNEELTIQNWQPNILDFINPSNIKKDTPLKFTRKILTNVPAPQTSIPFMPKFIESDETHELYFYSKNKYVIIMKVKNSKAPYTDSFYLRYKKVVETKGQNMVRFENNLKLVFIKKTMVQGMIESRTIKQSIENNKSMTDEIQKYLKYLENTLVKKNSKKGDKIYDMSTTDGGILNESRNLDENQLLNPQSQELKKKLESSNTQKDILKKILFVSLLLNAVFFLIILCGGSSKDELQKIEI